MGDTIKSIEITSNLKIKTAVAYHPPPTVHMKVVYSLWYVKSYSCRIPNILIKDCKPLLHQITKYDKTCMIKARLNDLKNVYKVDQTIFRRYIWLTQPVKAVNTG